MAITDAGIRLITQIYFNLSINRSTMVLG